MITRKPLKNGRVKVTFTLPEGLDVARASVVGEFNAWNPAAHPMKRDKKGRWTATPTLDAGRTYEFRYLVNEHLWINDDTCACQPNPFGSENALLQT